MMKKSVKNQDADATPEIRTVRTSLRLFKKTKDCLNQEQTKKETFIK